MDIWTDEQARILPGLEASLSIMDYSSSLHDPENPAGASPWGSSPQPSPQHNRAQFGSPSADNDVPSSVYQADVASSNGSYAHNGQNYNTAAGSSVAESATGSSVDGRRPDTADSMVEPQQAYAPVLQQQQPDPPRYNQEQQRQATPRQPSRQGPQYRLQAKLTGLERTGRKDPILRFDVYVHSLKIN